MLVTSRTNLRLQQVLEHYDDRVAMESEIKADKHDLGLSVLRKHELAAWLLLPALKLLTEDQTLALLGQT